jgi:chromate transporter
MNPQAKQQPLSVDRAQTVSFTLRDLLLYFLRLGTFGFGGPIALAGYMQRDLVEQRRWVSKSGSLTLIADHFQAGYPDVASFGRLLLFVLLGFTFLLLG